jgi:DNA-directed RNA polymerase subunit H (RpoH/RPB5)
MSTIDLIVRSRPVILEILESRGYDISTYRDVAPTDIYSMASKKPSILAITAKKVPEGPAPKERVVVLYWTDKAYRQSAASILEKMIYSKLTQVPEGETASVGGAGAAAPAGGEIEDTIDPNNDEIIIMLSEPFHELYTQLAIHAWSKKVRISFFPLKNLISNPASHVMVPPHRKLTPDETAEVLKNLHMRSVNEFPHIKFHFDIQARVLGLVPGDVVEIQRPSETAGIYTFYRVCAP